MKKLLLSLVAVAAITFGANAQTEKGKIILGGNVGFSSTKVDGAAKVKTNSFGLDANTFAPKLGVQFYF